MSLQIGIVGLPNAGKSTLFNALTSSQNAAAENFPFCTIDPNVGKVPVPDERIFKLAEVAKSQKIVPESVEFVDIAGLVEGASKGEGLGNKFLAHIRETDAVLLVIRFFDDKNVIHHLGAPDPTRDKEILETELILKDLETVEKSLEKAKKDSKAGDKEKITQKELLEKIYKKIANGEKANTIEYSNEESKFVKTLNLLTTKKFLFAANVSEDELTNFDIKSASQKIGLKEDEILIPISAKIESEISLLNQDEKKEFLESLGLEKSGLENLISQAYKILGLITYFTAGEKEARAWAVKKDSTAPEAAGKIHTDFEKGFIKADSVKYEDFINYGGWNGAKEKGLVQIVGKDHIVQDGEILIFRFNV